MYQLLDGHGNIDLMTNDKLMFIVGIKNVLVEYIWDCINMLEDDEIREIRLWNSILGKVVHSHTLEDLQVLIDEEFSHMIIID